MQLRKPTEKLGPCPPIGTPAHEDWLVAVHQRLGLLATHAFATYLREASALSLPTIPAVAATIETAQNSVEETAQAIGESEGGDATHTMLALDQARERWRALYRSFRAWRERQPKGGVN